ncbi:MAG: hypothetical protein ACR2I5_09370 [Candidatus Limnocylindria bacterium]
MSVERGVIAAEHTVRRDSTGALGVLVLISILRLVILLGWRDGGRSAG